MFTAIELQAQRLKPLSDKDANRVDVLLLERLVPAALAWLELRRSAAAVPEIAAGPQTVRIALQQARTAVLPR